MANINTSGAASGRDFSYGASPIREEVFMDLYDEIIIKIRILDKIQDETTFKIELNKIRKKMSKLITKYFEGSLSELATQGLYKEAANKHMIDLQNIRETLSV